MGMQQIKLERRLPDMLPSEGGHWLESDPVIMFFESRLDHEMMYTIGMFMMDLDEDNKAITPALAVDLQNGGEIHNLRGWSHIPEMEYEYE